MTEEIKSDKMLLQQLADFKRQNPKVAEAMELFGITLAKYQETLHALYSPHIYQATSTADQDKLNQ
jgi:ferric iron reductase protein FhuF